MNQCSCTDNQDEFLIVIYNTIIVTENIEYEGINAKEAANQFEFNCFTDSECKHNLPVIDCCFNPTNYFITDGKCCQWWVLYYNANTQA